MAYLTVIGAGLPATFGRPLIILLVALIEVWLGFMV